MSFWKWSQTAATNNTADSSINWQEGQAPSTVNNSARAMMAAAAKYRDDASGNVVTGGTATAYTITTNQTLTALTDGFAITARLSATSGAAPTLNVDSLGAKAIATVYGTAIPTGAMLSGSVHTFVYDSTDDKWIVHGRFADYLTSADNPDVVAIEALSGTTGALRKTAANTWALDDGVFNLSAIIGDGVNVVATGIKGDIHVPIACTITGVFALADQTGSIVIDAWKDSYSNYPPTDADSITASAPITISSGTKSTDTTLTGWTTSVSAGDIIRLNVDSVSAITRCTVAIRAKRFI